MAQGKEWNKDEVIQILEPIFKMGCNVTKACAYAGIPRTTVQTWIENDEELRLKVTLWQNEPNLLARSQWIAKMASADGYDSAKEWLRRKEKDEFSERQELTGADGENFPTPIISLSSVPGNNSNKKDSSTSEED